MLTKNNFAFTCRTLYTNLCITSLDKKSLNFKRFSLLHCIQYRLKENHPKKDKAQDIQMKKKAFSSFALKKQKFYYAKKWAINVVNKLKLLSEYYCYYHALSINLLRKTEQ